MSQCVPNWDLDDRLPNPSTATTATANIHAPTSDYVVSELTWEKVHASKDGFHGSPPRRAAKLPQKRPPTGGDPSWEKHHASGTLEAVVDQACTRALVIPEAVDALVPSAKLHDQLEHLPPARVVPDVVAGVGGAAAAAASGGSGRKRSRAGTAAGDGYSRSATGSGASASFTFDSCDINGGEETGFATSASPLDRSTPETEHASCGRALTAVSEDDDSYYSRRQSQKYVSDEEEKNEKERSTTMPIRRIRVAAVHNQSERKRRDRINQRMRTLQKLVPNSSKCDKASILDEVIDYMRQLQAQVQMMSSMSPAMMMPMAAMQQMQMAVMAQMAQMAQMGMAMGMGMPDMGQPGMPSWAAAAAAAGFLPPSLPRDIRDYPTPQASAPAPDPFASYMAFQTQQQMAMDARSRMAAGLCQRRPHQQPPPGSTKENQSRGDLL